MAANPYQVYKQQSVMTMTQGEMLGKLYEEIVKQLRFAQVYIGEKDYGKTNDALQRAQRILNHLKATLDHQYEVAGNLEALYNYFLQQIVSANIKKSAQPLEEVIPMVEELGEAFAQADRQLRTGKKGGNP